MKHAKAILIITAVALFCYWNSFKAPFVFDDLLTIQRNAKVRFSVVDLNPLHGRALLYLTFTANYYFGGQNVWGYHAFNLALHIVNGVLVYFIGRRIFDRKT